MDNPIYVGGKAGTLTTPATVTIPVPLMQQIIRELISGADPEDTLDVTRFFLGIGTQSFIGDYSISADLNEEKEEVIFKGQGTLQLLTKDIVELYDLHYTDGEGNRLEMSEDLTAIIPEPEPEVAEPTEEELMAEITNSPVRDEEVEAELKEDGAMVFPGSLNPTEPGVEAKYVGVKRVLIKKNQHFITYHAETISE